jgi:hypothetical protein
MTLNMHPMPNSAALDHICAEVFITLCSSYPLHNLLTQSQANACPKLMPTPALTPNEDVPLSLVQLP